MAGTVLGKRFRGDNQTDDTPARSTRAKKRATTSDTVSTKPSSIAVASSRSAAVQKRHVAPKPSTRITKKAHPSSPLSPNKRAKLANSTIEIWQDDKEQKTPSTPSHRDALSKLVAVTPRHRLIATSLQGTPRTPRTPARASTVVYNQARELFSRSSDPGRLSGRDEEREEVSTFIQQRVETKSGGCLYISGPPGTGKSALLSEVQGQFYGTTGLKTATINCMSIRNASDFTNKISTELDLPVKLTKDGISYDALNGEAQCLLILDEVDRLVELDLAILYSMFEWSMASDSRLIMIGIANALDLTDRCLPKLKSRGLKPNLLPFMPYNAAQIASVLTSKLKSLGGAEESGMPPFLHPAAIQFCAKKVAAQTGDLRKAFDICRRAIDLVEKETLDRDAKQMDSPSKMPLMENINLASSPLTPKSPAKSPTKQLTSALVYTVASAPKATIAHMARITAQVFSSGASQRLSTLNLQQKAVLCSLAALEKRKQASQLQRTMYDTPSKTDRSAPTIKQLCDSYSLLCKQTEMLHPLSALDFRDVVSGLEAQSLISNADGKGGSFQSPITPSRTPSRKLKSGFAGISVGDERRVASVVGHKELETLLQGPGADLLKQILDGQC